ncbi:MAG: hypothetical protein ACLU8W_05820 [Clostridia bacterium]
MKMNLKPWQIGICCAAGIAILGGAGTGIYFGVNRSIDDKVKEQVDAAMESMYSSEAALDESETPTQAAGETTTESTTAAQPTKEPETVIYVAPTETAKSETSPAPDPQPEPEPEPEIELVYDEQLTKEVAELLGTRYPKDWTDGIYNDDGPLENGLEALIEKGVYSSNSEYIFIKKTTTPSAQSIVSDWTNVRKYSSMMSELRVYKTSNNLICAVMYI